MYKQRDIVLAKVVYTNQYQAELRPALVISNDLVNSSLDCVLLPITHVLRNDDYSFLLSDDLVSVPMKQASEVRTHKVFVLEKKAIVKRIAVMNEEGFRQVMTRFGRYFEQET
ncbi:MAG: type II toxin-antitoxin system PemK/MazF family toxin [Thermoflexibacter sp.]|jgi:mRNA-degrading endonuclease toxin of MazEF toxin-antitoxin module|nr:type II toxin-antitoxin system PemK/MazF family toxin [Thermoflexibacter sp.]